MVTWMSRIFKASPISGWRAGPSEDEVLRFFSSLRFPLGDLDRHWNFLCGA